jgi:hypothetical protein
MTCTRRRFIRSVGVTLASLVVSRVLSACKPQSCADWRAHPAWARLRQCWLNLENSSGLRGQLDVHRAALDELVEAGQLEWAVADQLQLAYAAAAGYANSNRPFGATCYMTGPPPEVLVTMDLALQANTLRQAAQEFDLDSDTVAQAQAAIARDMTFVQAIQTGKVELGRIQQQFRDGQLDASPEAAKAACILVDLLLRDVK